MQITNKFTVNKSEWTNHIHFKERRLCGTQMGQQHIWEYEPLTMVPE